VSDPSNLENHFVNASGLLSYEFFKEQSDYEFVDWDYDASTQSEEEYLMAIFHESGLEVYRAEYEHLEVYTCRIVVPGVSEIYPVDDLVWRNNNVGSYLREKILNLKNLEAQEWNELLQELEEGAFNEVRHVTEYIGIIPDEGTLWESLQIDELKCMLALAIGDKEAAKEFNEWALHVSNLDEKRTRHHRCLAALLEIDLDDEKDYEEYAPSLKLMYGEETVACCSKIISREEVFHGLHSPGLSLEGFTKHQKLLEAYEKVQKAKKAFSLSSCT
jgi:ribosomal protein S12 methylthiotransferase accessory factor